ncbi:MAG: PilZ domain-containing protein [Candidatus Melainabacteria bacterium]
MLDIFKTLSVNQTLKARYEIQPGVQVFCMLRVLTVSEEEQLLVVTVGIRKDADSILQKGSMITIPVNTLENLDMVMGDGLGVVNMSYQGEVIRVERKGAVGVHILKLSAPEVVQHRRTNQRYNVQLQGSRGNKIKFQTSNVSRGGLQFISDSVLTSAIINKEMTVQLSDGNGGRVNFECVTKYIFYNWWEHRHQVGVQFAMLNAIQKDFLDRVLPPESQLEAFRDEQVEEDAVKEASPKPQERVPVAAQAGNPDEPPPAPEDESPEDNHNLQTKVDTESGRIRFKH